MASPPSDQCQRDQWAQQSARLCLCIRVGPQRCPVTLSSIRSLQADASFLLGSIDGVLLRASQPLPGASETLAYLDVQQIPFIFLTNGGGVHETERVERLNKQLGLALTPNRIVQSHTPFTELVKGADETARAPLENKCVLVIGGNGDKCRQVAERFVLLNEIQGEK